eukprot:scaffold31903_cov104-Isochrysis_galbana.AAC.6
MPAPPSALCSTPIGNIIHRRTARLSCCSPPYQRPHRRPAPPPRQPHPPPPRRHSRQPASPPVSSGVRSATTRRESRRSPAECAPTRPQPPCAAPAPAPPLPPGPSCGAPRPVSPPRPAAPLGSHSSILPRSQRTSALRSSPPPCDALTSCVSSNKVSSTACRVTARCSRSKLVARKAEGSSPSSRLHWKTAARNESVSAAGSGCVGSVKARAGMSRFLLAGGAASAYASVQQRISPTAQAWAR